jgi:hypothetical protein
LDEISEQEPTAALRESGYLLESRREAVLVRRRMLAAKYATE